MSSDSSSSSDSNSGSSARAFVENILLSSELRSLARGYRCGAPSPGLSQGIPEPIAPIRSFTHEEWMEIEREAARRRVGSGGEASNSGRMDTEPQVPHTIGSNPSPSELAQEDLPGLSEDRSRESGVGEIDTEAGAAGVAEPEFIDLEDDDLNPETEVDSGIRGKAVLSPDASERREDDPEEEETTETTQNAGQPEAEQQGIEYGDDWESIPPSNPKFEPCKYVSTYFDGSAGKLAEFRRTYNIPGDVEISRVTGGRIRYREGQITVPLMAITEGGLTFPLPRLLRCFLQKYGLAPHQLSVNIFRVICSVARLSERHGIPFSIYDLSAVYTCSRSRQYGRYYFTIRPEYPYLIEKLYDSERWASEFVEVRGNFMWNAEEEGTYPVPWARGDPGYPRGFTCVFLT